MQTRQSFGRIWLELAIFIDIHYYVVAVADFLIFLVAGIAAQVQAVPAIFSSRRNNQLALNTFQFVDFVYKRKFFNDISVANTIAELLLNVHVSAIFQP